MRNISKIFQNKVLRYALCILFVFISFYLIMELTIKEGINTLKNCSSAKKEKGCYGVRNKYCVWHNNACYDYGECKNAHSETDCKNAANKLKLPCFWTKKEYSSSWGGNCDVF